MQTKVVLFAAFATFGMVDARCSMQAMSGPNCTGKGGRVLDITRSNRCINVEGRKSYLVHGADCGDVRVFEYWKNSCSGTADATNDIVVGQCHKVGPSKRMNIKKVH